MTQKLDPALLQTLAADSAEDLAKTLGIDPDKLGTFAATIRQNPLSTIEPSMMTSDAPGRRALAGLGAEQEQAEEHGIGGGLDIERTIGEGGMGVVRIATQRSLGRKVAVKTLRPGKRDEAATLRLLREAWVTGSLEHPNIVPVYDLGLGEDGTPVVVLKLIEGSPWDSVIRDAPSQEAMHGAIDLLEYNLRILVQLCNAVALAHARGIIHRDLKPENVMIGKFGEVYLVDWGIAVSVRADDTGRLPLASESKDMAGTPCYMAPEMLGGIGVIDERTDVYLLGAILHEILTGAAPHQGTFKQIVGSILMSTFGYDPEVPRELTEIARRAMSRESAARFQSVEEMRLRIEWYLRHRGSLALSGEAGKRVVEMKALLDERAQQTEARGKDDMRERLHHLFAECRFGFRQALAASADNAQARDGLREATETVVGYELSFGTAEAAAAALAELDSPPRELAARVSEALAKRAAEKAKYKRLDELDSQLDPAIGRRTRLFIGALMSICWISTPFAIRWRIIHDGAVPPSHVITGTLLMVAFSLSLGFWGRESMTKTFVNRRLIATIMMMYAMELALEICGLRLGISMRQLLPLMILPWAVGSGAVALYIDKRIWPSFVGHFLAFMLSAYLPDYTPWFMSLSNVVIFVNFAFAWTSIEEDRAIWTERRERIHRRLSIRPPAPPPSER